MKNLKPRDILEFILFGFGFLALIILAGFLESAPLASILWIAVGFALFLWLVFIIIVARQRNQEARAPKLKIMRNGQWVDVLTGDKASPRRPVQLFDQDEDAIKHLDYDTKEQQA